MMFRKSVIVAVIAGAASTAAFAPLLPQDRVGGRGSHATTALCMSTEEKTPFVPMPDQGTRTTMNPYYQIDKYSVYPPDMQETRFGAGLPSYKSLPAAASKKTEPAEKPSSDNAKKVSSIPDQGASTTMPRMRLENGGAKPLDLKW